MKKVTPLEYKKFFAGTWKGEGVIVPQPLIQWLVAEEKLRFVSETQWLSDTIWMVKEHFEFFSGRTIRRTVFAEVTGPGRLHVTSDDLPKGADMTLKENGFIFDPYDILASYRGMTLKLRCLDENLIDDQGMIHDMVKMYFAGLPLATMYLTVERNVKAQRNTKNSGQRPKKQSKRD